VSREKAIEAREASVQAVAGTHEARENAFKHDRAALEAENELFEVVKKHVEDDRAALVARKKAIFGQKEAMKSRDTSTADIITLKVGKMKFEVLPARNFMSG